MMRLSRIGILGVVVLVACGDDDSEADRAGVGAECSRAEDCRSDQQCLPFRGGYCGLPACTGDEGCPAGSACVRHTDGMNYCFRVCLDKADCNRNRSSANEANCSANLTFVVAGDGRKACVPPSGS